MTATYQHRYISVVKCDGKDCDSFDAQEGVIFDHPSDADEHGKNHEWATRAGMNHYCDSCWCDGCDEPLGDCAHASD